MEYEFPCSSDWIQSIDITWSYDILANGDGTKVEDIYTKYSFHHDCLFPTKNPRTYICILVTLLSFID